MVVSFIKHKKIKTTHARAKELRRFIEPLITFAKKGDLHSRRQVLKKIKHKEIVQTLFNEIAPMYANRPGGYTRITKLGFRDNDRASVSLIEFIDYVESTDSKGKNWFTIGVSTNIIDASFKALVDSLDYKLFKDNAPASI